MERSKQFKPKQSAGHKSFNGRKMIDALYDKKWELYSRIFLKENPICYSCGSKSEAVDHIRPHKGDVVLFKKLDNHLPLCHKCHNTVTTRFDRNYRPGQPITEKLQWIAQKRSEHRVTVRVRVLASYL